MSRFSLAKIVMVLQVLCCFTKMHAQNVETDSLKKALSGTNDEFKRVKILESLSYAYLASYPDTALQYALQGLDLAREINSAKGEAICTNALGNVYFHTGDNVKALEMYLKYLRMKENLKDNANLSVAFYNIASAYTEEKDYENALAYVLKAKREDEKKKDSSSILYDLYSLGSIYGRMENKDSALYYTAQCYRFANQLDDKNMMGAILNLFGETFFSMDSMKKATEYYMLSIPFTEIVNDNEVLTSNYFGLAKVFKAQGLFDSAVYYGRKACQLAIEAPFFKQVLETSIFLTDIFAVQKRFDSAYTYQKLSINTKDSLYNAEAERKVQNMKLQEQQRQNLIETAQIKFRNKIKLYAATFLAIVLLVTALIFARNYKRKKKDNALLKKTLADLTSTQSQLIQSEKMASLGELTAGIAHEIQNPLNFVNNFSEVNNELIEELKSQKSTLNSAEQDEILNDIFQNNEKINHHGKRADAIVKGMLQHSRSTTSIKEPTDINKLADEYLRLAYHGLRAKDKSFNATLKTNYDERIDKINVIPQDIGRVILNLITNAFYAVDEKKKSGLESYEPTVSVITQKNADKIEIKVADNGNGIPKNIFDKIFQPFFTTKPTGQGTGLGLSLAYDIIKAHGGVIHVETNESQGSEFSIRLPIS